MQGKVMPNEAESEVYVGIDVCKAWLDVYLHPSGQVVRVANSEAGLEALARTFAGHAIARYDSRDGYGPHPHEADYIAADAEHPNPACPA